MTLVHKGNIMKFTEGAFRDWGYELAREEFGATEVDGGPWYAARRRGDQGRDRRRLSPADPHPAAEYGVVATPNLNGDYISDALAAQVDGIGIALGANINSQTGRAVRGLEDGMAGLIVDVGAGAMPIPPTCAARASEM